MTLESVLRPILQKFEKANDSQDLAAVGEFYHDDVLMASIGEPRNVVLGKEAVLAEFKKFYEMSGPATNKVLSEKFIGSEDLILYSASSENTSDKLGTLKAEYEQIFRKYGDKYLIIHDQYNVLG